MNFNVGTAVGLAPFLRKIFRTSNLSRMKSVLKNKEMDSVFAKKRLQNEQKTRGGVTS